MSQLQECLHTASAPFKKLLKTFFARFAQVLTVLVLTSCNPIIESTYDFKSDSLDRTAPTNTSVAFDAATTSFPTQTLTLSAIDDSPIEMCVAEATDCSTYTCTYEKFEISKILTLSPGNGVKKVCAKFRDSLGNVSFSPDFAVITYNAPTVSSAYAGGSNWNEYVQTAATGSACVGTEISYEDCIHAGEFRKVSTYETSCVGLSAADSNPFDNTTAFTWTCSIINGYATFTGSLAEGKGISDLINWSNTAAPEWPAPFKPVRIQCKGSGPEGDREWQGSVIHQKKLSDC